MNLDIVFGFTKTANDVPPGVASTHGYEDQPGTPEDRRLITVMMSNPTAWEKFKRGARVSALATPAGVGAGMALGNLLDNPAGKDLGGVIGGLAGLGYGVYSGMNTPRQLFAYAAPLPSNIPNQEPSHVEASKLASLRSVFGFNKAAAPVVAPGLLKQLGIKLKGRTTKTAVSSAWVQNKILNSAKNPDVSTNRLLNFRHYMADGIGKATQAVNAAPALASAAKRQVAVDSATKQLGRWRGLTPGNEAMALPRLDASLRLPGPQSSYVQQLNAFVR